MKQEQEESSKQTAPVAKSLSQCDYGQMESLLQDRGYIYPSFSLYGGSQGLYDYGPLGAQLKSELLNYWRKIFVHGENNYEIDCTMMTPENIFVASGHVAKFSDYITLDSQTGTFYRADHLIKAALRLKIDELKKKKESIEDVAADLASLEEADRVGLSELIKKYSIAAPETGNALTDLEEFNLMFKTQLGPVSQKSAYLRPETAQGMFLNFPRLLAFNQEKLPFGIAQIGKAFRNEIAPRGGLLRVREFDMAEIEYFFDPDTDRHNKFSKVCNVEVVFLPKTKQTDHTLSETEKLVKMTLKEALDDKILSSEILAYYIAKIQLFLVNVGICPEKIRFRQHLDNEMAHYANDCWDGEIYIDGDWVECTGLANRCSYDLECHEKATGKNLRASVLLEKPYPESKYSATCNRKQIYDKFGTESKKILEFFNKASQEELGAFKKDMDADKSILARIGQDSYELSKEMVKIDAKEVMITHKKILPQVIEPSFGIGRIIAGILEHCCLTRESDKSRVVFNFPAVIAPVKVSVFTLQRKDALMPVFDEICELLRVQGIPFNTDLSGTSIGKRYTRSDMQGIPFAVTIDFDTVKDEKQRVTLRERNSMTQMLVPLNDLLITIVQLTSNMKLWSDFDKVYERV